MDSSILALCAVFTVYILWYAQNQRRVGLSRLPLPPGPRPLPIIGNLRDVPIEGAPWKVFDAMAQKYGDVMHLSVFGRNTIILSSMTAIADLFEKRATTYSDRVHSVMLFELMGFDRSFSAMPYGERWRRTRRAFHQYFNANAVSEYQTVQTQQARELLGRLHRLPEYFLQHTRHYFAATIMKITYGIDVAEANDEYITIAEESIQGVSTAAQLGRYYVEFLPFLKYLPPWLPGATFRKQAEHWNRSITAMFEKPFNVVKNSMKTNSYPPSIASTMLDNIPDGPNRDEQEEIASSSTGTAYAAGADTTISYVQTFFLAMAIHPEIQKKAQTELDAVVGQDRLPEFYDRPSLPYIEAVIKEILRWQPVTPLGVFHRTTESDEYRGYHIPKGTCVIGNAWSILHNPETYPDPEAFQPERFLEDGKLNPDVLNPTVACFGFGRRICPGQHLAVNSLYSIVTSVLHTFDITPVLDKDGNPIPLRPEMSPGLVSFPEPFSCSIKPRSAAAESLIINSCHCLVNSI